MYTANVDGVAQRPQSVRRSRRCGVWFTSSAAAIGEEEGTVGDESSPHRGHFLSQYERSKYLAEQAVFAERTPVEVVAVNVLRAGARRASGTGKLILQVIDGKLPVLVDTRVSMVDIDDCARGHLLAEEGHRDNATSSTASRSPIRQALDLLERVTVGVPRCASFPGWLALAGAGAYGAAARIMGKHPRFCWEMARTMLHGHAYDGSRATARSGSGLHPGGGHPPSSLHMGGCRGAAGPPEAASA